MLCQAASLKLSSAFRIFPEVCNGYSLRLPAPSSFHSPYSAALTVSDVELRRHTPFIVGRKLFFVDHLPTELLPIVLSFISPSALSDRQIGSIVQYALDRTTLLPKSLKRPTVERRTRAISKLFENLLSRRGLGETGCNRYDD